MTKRTKIAYTLSNGDVVCGGRTTIDRKVEDLLQMGTYGGSMVRMGDHSVFVGYFDVAVSANYFDSDDHDPVWKCAAMRDTRIGQIAQVLDAMKRVPNHPFYATVVTSCNAELTRWDAHGETPKYYGG